VPFLDLARILAILGVVGIHTLAGGVADGSVGLLGLILNMTLTCSVPVFFMISGALTLDPRSHRAGPGEFLRRRAVRVLPALVIWSAFYMVVISGWVSGQQWTPSTVLDRIVTDRGVPASGRGQTRLGPGPRGLCLDTRLDGVAAPDRRCLDP
jgi:peptidoglycan/LPS O-acetylase OafA/YrhL